MLNAGLEDAGSCDLLLGRSSGAFLGDVGDGAGGVWLAIEVLIDAGRTEFVRLIPVLEAVADVVLLFRLWVGGCEFLMLAERVRPVAFGA